MSDVNKSNNSTDFVLSSRALRAMALHGKDQQILKLGVVDVEYKRYILRPTFYVSCVCIYCILIGSLLYAWLVLIYLIITIQLTICEIRRTLFGPFSKRLVPWIRNGNKIAQ